MLRTLLLFSLLAFFEDGIAIDDDNLRNALNSIENRQRQLESNYYVLPNKNADRALQSDDGNLMYLDATSNDYDVPHQVRNPHTSKLSKNSRLYDEDRLSDDEAEEYQRRLNERLLEQLMLDLLKNDDAEIPSHRRPQKKSFFREREINEVSENLQNLYPVFEKEENAFFAPLPLRERIKPKSHSTPHRRLVKPYDVEEVPEEYLNSVNPMWRKYQAPAGQTFDPETLSDDEAEQFVKYLTKKDDNDDYNGELYLLDGKERDRSKRWRGSANPKDAKYSIRKRSAGFEEKSAVEATSIKPNVSRPADPVVKSNANETKSHMNPKKMHSEMTKSSPSKRGQDEVPISLQSSKPLNIKKKSVDWSGYFGVDKRQKKSSPNTKEQHKNDVLLDQYIQSHILKSVRNFAFNNHGNRYFPKRGVDRSYYSHNEGRRSQTADDLKTAEDLLIDHVLKYTGAHEGITDPVELERFRQNVIDELAAAYSLEKLRNDLLDGDGSKQVSDRTKKVHQHSNIKRVAVKKENAELLPSDLDDLKIKSNGSFHKHDAAKKSSHDYNKYHYNVNEINTNECPVLNQIIDKCLQISSNVKDRDNTFTPFCTLYQICNICGEKEDSISCDLSFFSDANAICGEEPLCRYTAERILYILQSSAVKLYMSTNTCDTCIAEILQYSYEK